LSPLRAFSIEETIWIGPGQTFLISINPLRGEFGKFGPYGKDRMLQPNAAQEILEAVKRSFRVEPRLGPRFRLDQVAMESDGMLVLEGQVARLPEKKLALLRAAAVPGVAGIIDRLHVLPVTSAGDRQIRARLRDLFAQDPDFSDLELREDLAESITATDYKRVSRGSGLGIGHIDVRVQDGIVTLDGIVPTLVRKRLAGAMAWWIPGVRDVINGVAVNPPEDDGPDQIEEAVRIVLERNPAIDAAQIRVGVRGRVVHLTGLVRSAGTRDLAEADTFAIFGVDDVINDIAVSP
jgi:osmotically-inducible protein OsmY